MKFFAAIAAAAAVRLTQDGEWAVDGFYKPQDIGTGPLDKKYERVPPEHFAAESDDLFMHSMIMNMTELLCATPTRAAFAMPRPVSASPTVTSPCLRPPPALLLPRSSVPTRSSLVTPVLST